MWIDRGSCLERFSFCLLFLFYIELIISLLISALKLFFFLFDPFIWRWIWWSQWISLMTLLSYTFSFAFSFYLYATFANNKFNLFTIASDFCFQYTTTILLQNQYFLFFVCSFNGFFFLFFLFWRLFVIKYLSLSLLLKNVCINMVFVCVLK